MPVRRNSRELRRSYFSRKRKRPCYSLPIQDTMSTLILSNWLYFGHTEEYSNWSLEKNPQSAKRRFHLSKAAANVCKSAYATWFACLSLICLFSGTWQEHACHIYLEEQRTDPDPCHTWVSNRLERSRCSYLLWGIETEHDWMRDSLSDNYLFAPLAVHFPPRICSTTRAISSELRNRGRDELWVGMH